MPRYFFHTLHESLQRDEEGTEFQSDAQAWKEGVAACSELMHDLDGHLDDGPEYRMQCEDETGRKVFVLHFSAEKFFH